MAKKGHRSAGAVETMMHLAQIMMHCLPALRSML